MVGPVYGDSAENIIIIIIINNNNNNNNAGVYAGWGERHWSLTALPRSPAGGEGACCPLPKNLTPLSSVGLGPLMKNPGTPLQQRRQLLEYEFG